MNKNNNTLEFDVIKNILAEYASTEYAKKRMSDLTPSVSVDECTERMKETTEARQILESFGNPPLPSMNGLDKILTLTEKDAMLLPEQLDAVVIFLAACRRVKLYLKKAEILDNTIALYGNTIYELNDLYEEIYRSVKNGEVDDNASPALKNVRRKIINVSDSIKAKLDSILKSKKEWFSDGYVTMKSGRYVLPVKKEYKNQVSGSVVEISNSGGTYFIEPSAVQRIQDEISLLRVEEDSEIRRILYSLTAMVEDNISELKINMECVESLDFVFSKAKLSVNMDAIPVPLTIGRNIVIKNGRHPLIDKNVCIPLNFEFGEGINGIVITGPNTGGKTVALKTVGLLSVMAQCGLHVPADEGSSFCMRNEVLCDIGDGQSITENLSTFSAHITNIIDILKSATDESLVLLDELGSGTDPNEGMGLAVSILEELNSMKCLFVATTHYPEIKEFAAKTDGLINAKMEFDKESLQPLYRLSIGEAGESCAFHIARKLGFSERMLRRAYNEAYKNTKKNVTPYEMTFYEDGKKLQKNSAPKIKDSQPKDIPVKRCDMFNIGDSVIIYPQKDIGIIYKKADEKGMLGVQIKQQKQLINHKRIKLKVPASELYPEDYDFSIIFDSVANRKARHKMTKSHQPDLMIVTEKDEQQ